MRGSDGRGWQKAIVLEAFVLSNHAFLVLDVYLAHSVNRFRHPAEWIPVGFSFVAALGLASALIARLRGRAPGYVRGAGLVVGFASIAVGLAGVVYHLDSQFFSQWTIRSLVYTAPFAAPAAYMGLGLLLWMNRAVPPSDAAWSQWVIAFAAGGFLGNFVLSLCDHAMNGFFHATEWVPVIASGLAVGFLGVAVVERHRLYLWLTVAVLVLQVVSGLAGGYLHLAADVNGLSASRFEHFIDGAPVFAPLLFVDLALLALIGIWDRLQ